MAAGMTELAHSIAAEPGLIWKLWTENPAAGEAGGIYLFQEQAQAEAYLAMHTARLKQFGLSRINGKIFAVNETLSRLTRWPGGVHAG